MYLHGKKILIGGIMEKNISICNNDEHINDPTGSIAHDVRHTVTQYIDKIFLMSSSAAKYDDVCK